MASSGDDFDAVGVLLSTTPVVNRTDSMLESAIPVVDWFGVWVDASAAQCFGLIVRRVSLDH